MSHIVTPNNGPCLLPRLGPRVSSRTQNTVFSSLRGLGRVWLPPGAGPEVEVCWIRRQRAASIICRVYNIHRMCGSATRIINTLTIKVGLARPEQLHTAWAGTSSSFRVRCVETNIRHQDSGGWHTQWSHIPFLDSCKFRRLFLCPANVEWSWGTGLGQELCCAMRWGTGRLEIQDHNSAAQQEEIARAHRGCSELLG